MKLNGYEFIQKFYKIKTKDGELKTLKFNSAQEKFYQLIKENYGKKPGRYIVLKARQLGISTFAESILSFLTTTNFNTNAVIIAHDTKSASKIYQMTKLMVNSLPDILKPGQKYSNEKLLMFDRDDGKGLKSSISVMVANDSTRGSTFQLAHFSEVAFWQHPEIAMTSAMQAIPNTDNSIVIIESTANGFNYFYDMWKKAEEGKSDFIPVFFPWYIEEKYRMPYDGFELTQYELEIKDQFNLDNEQIAWRRWCIQNNCNGDLEKFRQEYPITPEEAFITSGTSVFDTQIVLDRMKKLHDPLRKGYYRYDYDGLHITNIQWVDDEKGYITIYYDPTDDFTVLSGDTAEDGEDYFAGHILDRSGKQCAVLHQQFDEVEFTRQIYCFGTMYHSLIALEVNYSTYPVRELQRLGYPYMYVRETFDTIQKMNVKKYGFKTTKLTRPTIISKLVDIMKDHIYLINDMDTLNEALSFVKIKGKPQASEGTHDDLIISIGIGYHALEQLPAKQEKKNENYYAEENEDMNFFDYGG